MTDWLAYLNFDPVDFGWTMLWVAPTLVALSVVALALHEIGHAAVGALVGIPIRRVHFGRGKPWAVVRVAGLWLIVARGWPGAGFVQAYASNHASPAARAAYFAGGILFNLLAAALPLALFGVPDGEAAFMLLYSWVSVNLLLAFKAALPKTMKGPDGNTPIARDGAKVVACFRADPKWDAWRKAALALLAKFGEGGPGLTGAEARAVVLGSETPPAGPNAQRAWVEEVDEVLTKTKPGRAKTCLATLARASLTKAGAEGFDAIVSKWPAAAAGEPAPAEAS